MIQALLFSFYLAHAGPERPIFSYAIASEPTSLKAAALTSHELGFLYSQLYQGLFRFDAKNGIIPVGARSCKPQGMLELVCKLSDRKWSDGSPVTAQHYVQAFQYLLAPDTKARDAGHLLNLKNASLILKGQAKPTELGILARDPQTLIFEFEKPTTDFINHLTSPLLVPFKEKPDNGGEITNGPYRVKQWIRNSKIKLEPNPYFPHAKKRPDVEVYFVEEDSTVLSLFDTGKLTFVRRIPTDLRPKYRNKSGYFDFKVSTFDYIGFGPSVEQNLRQVLSLGPDFIEFQKLMKSVGRPGCPGFESSSECLNSDAQVAKRLVSEIDEKNLKNLYLTYAKTSEDVTKGLEWFQNQWAKLGVKIELRPVDRGYMTQTLRASPPPLFRRSLSTDRPGCLANLENFGTGNPDNYIRLNNFRYDQILEKLNQAATERERKRLCREGLHLLLEEFRLIPLGPYELGAIVSPHFSGVSINELNQLNLEDLRFH